MSRIGKETMGKNICRILRRLICVCIVCFSAVTGMLGIKAFIVSQQAYTEVIKHFSCSIQLSMKFFKCSELEKCQEIQLCLSSDKLRILIYLLMNVKMPTVVGILTFMGRKKSCSAELSMTFYNLCLIRKNIQQ